MKKDNINRHSLMIAAALLCTTFTQAQQGVQLDIKNQRVFFTDKVTNDPVPTTINSTTTYDGLGAGTVGTYCSHYGAYAGAASTASASTNTFIGGFAGQSVTTGTQSTFVGFAAGGQYTGTGLNNAFFGLNSGWAQVSGDANTYLGSWAGFYNKTGNTNVCVGQMAGFNALGSGNVMLGFGAGYSETGSNKLYIHNSTGGNPLIWGDFGISKLVFNGKVSTGTSNQPTAVGAANTSAYTLFVKGGLLSDEVRVRTGWADYVFDKSYQLKPLHEVEAFINTNKRLPNVPSASQVETDGLNLGDMSRIQQEKIEELTLYIIQQQKEIDALKVQVQKIVKQ